VGSLSTITAIVTFPKIAALALLAVSRIMIPVVLDPRQGRPDQLAIREAVFLGTFAG
jgi:hypothetical protein